MVWFRKIILDCYRIPKLRFLRWCLRLFQTKLSSTWSKLSPKPLPRRYLVVRTHSPVTTLPSWNQHLKRASEQPGVSGLSWEQDGLHPNTILMEEGKVLIWARVVNSFLNRNHEFQSVMGCGIGPGYVQVAWTYCDFIHDLSVPCWWSFINQKDWITPPSQSSERQTRNHRNLFHIYVLGSMLSCVRSQRLIICVHLESWVTCQTLRLSRSSRCSEESLGLHSAAILCQPDVYLWEVW